MAARLLFLLTFLWAAAAQAECRDLQFDGAGFTICTFDPARDDLRLFLNDGASRPLASFENAQNLLGNGKSLHFAMNAGMYHPDRSPVGHYIENGQVLKTLITSAGPGNFGLLPNGVLCLEATRARVIETLRYQQLAPPCTHATQSGPMLVIDGALHPRFLPDSTSHFIRNGVGTSTSGDRIIFAISNNRVSFHHFARLFRDHLNLPQALYFDGRVSRLLARDLDRRDGGFPMGPIIGVVRDKAD